MDGEGRTMQEQLSRATHGAVAERGNGEEANWGLIHCCSTCSMTSYQRKLASILQVSKTHSDAITSRHAPCVSGTGSDLRLFFFECANGMEIS